MYLQEGMTHVSILRIMKFWLRDKLMRATAVYGFDFSYYLKNGFWLMAAQVMISVLSFGLTLGFANLLSREDYGSYKYVLSIFQLLAIFSLPEIGTAVILAIGKKRLFSIDKVVQVQRRWALLGLVAGAFLAGYMVYMGDRVGGFLIACAALLMPLHASYGIYDSLLRGVGDFKDSSLTNAYSQIAVVLAVLSALLLTRNWAVLALVFFGVSTATRAGYYFCYKSEHRFQKYSAPQAVEEAGWPALIQQAKHLSWIKGLGQLSGSVSQLTLFHLVGPATLSMYAIAIAPTEQVRGLLGMIGQLFLPKAVMRSWDAKQYKVFLKKRLPLFLLPVLVLCLLYLALAPFIFRVAFERYQDVTRLSQAYFFTLPLTLVNIILGVIVKAKERIRDLHQLNMLSIGVVLVVSLPLAVTFGLWGLVAGIILQKITEGIWMHYCILRVSVSPNR